MVIGARVLLGVHIGYRYCRVVQLFGRRFTLKHAFHTWQGSLCMKGPRCLRPIRSIFYMSRLQAILLLPEDDFTALSFPWASKSRLSKQDSRRSSDQRRNYPASPLLTASPVRPKVDIITQQATCFAPTRSSIFLLRLPGTAAVCPTDVTYLLAYRRILHQPSCRHSAVATTPYHTGDVLTKKSILDNTTNQKQSLCGARLKSRRAIRHIYTTTAQIHWRRCLHLKNETERQRKM